MKIVGNYSQMIRGEGHRESEVKGRIWRRRQMMYVDGSCGDSTGTMRTTSSPSPLPPRPRAEASQPLQKRSIGGRSSSWGSEHQHHEVPRERKMMRRKNLRNPEVVRRALSPPLARSPQSASAMRRWNFRPTPSRLSRMSTS